MGKGCKLSREEAAYICYLVVGIILGRGGYFNLTYRYLLDVSNVWLPYVPAVGI